MRFLVRFRVQNAPYPTLHEYFFREASRELERKLSHIISRHPSFQFLLTWRYFVAELRDYKPVRGRLGQVLFAKSPRNRMKNRMCKRALKLCGHIRRLPCSKQKNKHTQKITRLNPRTKHQSSLGASKQGGEFPDPRFVSVPWTKQKCVRRNREPAGLFFHHKLSIGRSPLSVGGSC